jgi:2-hydroxychromene-2-carboxylate isomerase
MESLGAPPSDPVLVDFFFDVVSPYTYFAWHVLKHYGERLF